VDRWGNVLTMSDARNANLVTSYTYNSNNQAIETTVPGTSGGVLKQVNEYDKLGRLRATSEIAQSTGVSERTVYEYDFKGTIVRETHADGGYITYTTDAFGQRLTSNQYLSASQSVTYSYVYDRMGNLISRTSGPVTVYDWYGYGAATSSTASYSRYIVDAYAYDELGRRTSTSNYYSTASNASTNASATKEGFTVTSALVYDLGGNIIKSTDANGLTTYRAYNALNNKVAEREATTAQGSVNALTLRWTYDDYGHVLTHTDLGGAVTRNTYNAAGQLASTTRTGGGGGIPAQTTNYVYESGTGNLVEVNDDNFVNDQWLHEQVRYSYDRAGNRITEQTWLKDDQGQLLRAIQDNALAYDARGQLTDITAFVTGADYRIHYNYDAFGNRDLVTTTFTNDVGDKKTITVNYKYDLMNRMKEVSGTVNTTYGNPVYTRPNLPSYKYDQMYEDWGDGVTNGWKYFDNKAIDSHTIMYDWAGNRTKDNAETYFYDAMGRLSTIQTNGALTGYRYYDSASRVIDSRDGTERQLNDYDAGGRIIVQRSLGYSDNVQHSLVKYFYDASFGFLSSYTAQGSTGAKWQTTSNNYDALGDTRMLSSTTVQNDGEAGTYKTSTMAYDLAGNMSRVTATNYKNYAATIDNANSRTMISDFAGHVLEKTQNGLRTHTLMANDEMIGYSSAAYESFSSVYEGLSNASKADISTYVVQSSTETLRSIAKSIWGDERLWYVIADANGLTTSDATLTAGQPLQIPAQAGTAFNGADTFKPYNAAEIIGSTTPEVALPVPQQSKGGGCGGLGQLVMVVVAVVATIYTAGAAAEFFAGGLSAVGSAGFAGTMAAGVGVGTAGFSAAAVAAGAIGGAMGSIASQVVGMAIGAQDGFNWKGVALSAIGGGVSAGMGGTFGKDVVGAMGRAALSNTITQGISIATGLQNGFDWRSVAAAGAGAAAGFKVSQAVGGLKMDDIFKQTASGMASGAAAAIARGGKIDIAKIATDAFGNALGNSLARANWNAGNEQTDRTAANGQQTNSSTDNRAVGLKLPTGTRFLVQPESDDGGMVLVDSSSDAGGSSGPLTDKFDLTNKSNFKAYLNAVNDQRVSGLSLDPQDIATSKALLFYYQGYAMGEQRGTAAELMGNLNDQSSHAFTRALEAFGRSTDAEQQSRYDFYSNIHADFASNGQATRGRYVDVTRDDRTIHIKWDKSFSNVGGALGVSADEALRKTDFEVYQAAINAAFETDGVNGFTINGAWRPHPSDYAAIRGTPSPLPNVNSQHISSRALDINMINNISVDNHGYTNHLPSTEEPEIIRKFTNNLRDETGIRQIFQPWRMLPNASNPQATFTVNHDVKFNAAGRPTTVPDANAVLHKNHLHFGF
jgi:YD repeat-containing protein